MMMLGCFNVGKPILIAACLSTFMCLPLGHTGLIGGKPKATHRAINIQNNSYLTQEIQQQKPVKASRTPCTLYTLDR